MGGRRPKLPEKERGWLLGRLAEKPDLTLHALPRKLGERGIVVSCDPLWRSLKREGVSFKKKCLRPSGIALTSPGAGPGGSDTQRKIDPARLVFIDETWAKTNMVRTHAWRRRGIPLRARVPHGHWRTMTFLAALRHDRIDAPCVIDGPINGESFRAYIEPLLVPTLQPGDIVVMDNLGSHNGRAVSPGLNTRPPHSQVMTIPPAKPRLCFSAGDEQLINAVNRLAGSTVSKLRMRERLASMRSAGSPDRGTRARNLASTSAHSIPRAPEPRGAL